MKVSYFLFSLFLFFCLLLPRPSHAKTTTKHYFGLGADTKISPFSLLRLDENSKGSLVYFLPPAALKWRAWVSPKFGFDLLFGFNMISQGKRSAKVFSPGFQLFFSPTQSESVRPYFGIQSTFHILTVLYGGSILLTLEPSFGVEFFPFKAQRLSINMALSIPVTMPISGGFDAVYIELGTLQLGFRYYW